MSQIHKNKKQFKCFFNKKPNCNGNFKCYKDSFFDGGKYINEEQISARCKKMLEEGATIIDIGAQSSRPGAN